MPDQLQAKRPHFILRDTSAVEFKAHFAGGGSTRSVPTLPRQQHGASLRDQVENLKPAAAEAVQGQRDLQLESGLGLQIQFSSQPDVELAFESLANETRNIELLSVRREGNQTFANVFVPDGKLAHFEKYISDYLEEKKDSRGQARDHRKLLDAIESIELQKSGLCGLTLPNCCLTILRPPSGGRSGFRFEGRGSGKSL